MDMPPPGFELVTDKIPPPPAGFELAGSRPAMSFGERFMQGAKDPAFGLIQMVDHALSGKARDAVDSTLDRVNQIPVIGSLTRKLGGPKTPQQFDQFLAQREESYRPPEGIDWARAGGNFTAMLPLAAMPTGNTLKGATALGALTGMTSGVAQPVTQNQDEFWSQKGKQGAIGAAGGAIAAPIMRGAASVISPQTREPAKLLMAEGITPTAGQILGGFAQRAEDKLTSLPILGDAITASRRSAVEDLNRAMFGRALNPIGGTMPKTVGREAVADVSTQLSAAYDRILPKLNFQADHQFATELATVRQMAATLPEAQAKRFEQLLQQQVLDKLTPQGLANGAKLKEIESQLGKFSSGYRGDQSFDVQQLGSALGEVQASIRRTLQRTNPQYADELARINQGYAAYTTIRNAAGRQGAADGVFTPAQLAAAVRAGDRSVGKGNYARGTARGQDLSDAGVNVLGPKYPDSGSIGRAFLGGGALGLGTINPMIPGALGVASLPYLPGGRQMAAALLSRRPAGAEPTAEALRRIPAGLLAPALYPFLE